MTSEGLVIACLVVSIVGVLLKIIILGRMAATSEVVKSVARRVLRKAHHLPLLGLHERAETKPIVTSSTEDVVESQRV